MKKFIVVAICLIASVVSYAQVLPESDAPEISLPGMNDSIINLSSLKGKVVLIDFWASWCRPCRQANIFNAYIYNKYKAKGFEIYAVSIDNNKKDWLKAIQQDKIEYTHVMDNAGWRSKVAERYGINALPSSVLIDKTGKIVALDIQGKVLEKRIKELLK